MKLPITCTWDGQALPPEERAEVTCQIRGNGLVVTVDAPFYDDPPPPGPVGSTEALWSYEVVELFLVGRDDRYLEIELGPRGHYLVLELHGRRRIIRQGLPITHRAEIMEKRWRSIATVSAAYLPPAIERANAYAIHGAGVQRRHLAAFPVPGPAPDFHRLESFGVISWPPTAG